MSSGTKYNLNDHSRRDYMPAIAVTIEVVTTILLWVRVANRFVTKSRLGFDDYLIIVAWFLGVLVTVTVLLGTERFGLDKHIWDVPQEDWWKDGFVAFLVEVFFFWSTCFTKISVLMFYRRLVEGTYSRNFKLAIWAAIAFVLAYTVTFFVIILVSCNPIEAIWRQYDFPWRAKHPNFHCTPLPLQTQIAKLVGSLSVVTDFYSVMLPAALVAKIRINKRQKYGLLFIFGVGFLVVGAGIARTVYLFRVFAEPFDKTWLTFNVFVASIIECNVAIICACAPSLKSLFGKFFSDMTTRYGSKSTGSSNLSSTAHSRGDSVTGNVRHTIGSAPNARVLGLDGQVGEKDENSFKAAHEYGRNYEDSLAVGYGEDLVLPSVRSHSPMTSVLFDKSFSLPLQNEQRNQGSYIISPSATDSSDDEASLVEKATPEQLAQGLSFGDPNDPRRSRPSARSRPDEIMTSTINRPSTNRGPLSPFSPPHSEVSFINEPAQPDPFMPSDNERPRIRRKPVKEDCERTTRFNAI